MRVQYLVTWKSCLTKSYNKVDRLPEPCQDDDNEGKLFVTFQEGVVRGLAITKMDMQKRFKICITRN